MQLIFCFFQEHQGIILRGLLNSEITLIFWCNCDTKTHDLTSPFKHKTRQRKKSYFEKKIYLAHRELLIGYSAEWALCIYIFVLSETGIFCGVSQDTISS